MAFSNPGLALSFRLALVLGFALQLVAPCWSGAAAAKTYDLGYRFELLPEEGLARVRITLGGSPKTIPSRVTFSIDPQRHRDFEGDGKVSLSESVIVWEPPSKGGHLDYAFEVNRKRGPKAFDARMTKDWAIFRGDHLVPAVSVLAPGSAASKTTVEFVLVDGWSVLTPYPTIEGKRGTFDDPKRRWDRPKGWLLAGKIGSRREVIAGVEVVVAGPIKQGLRRLDMLATLNWTFPHLTKIFPNMPKRLLIVTARDPMWRGGLSGPGSLFLHGDRPLISENRTSTLLHELVHVASNVHADDESDWIVEGMAEYYSVELLRRSGGISELRYKETMAGLAAWGSKAKTLFTSRSSGPTTALGAVVLQSVDAEIREASEGKKSLDDVVRALADEDQDVSLARMSELAAQAAGRPIEALRRDRLPDAKRKK